MASVVSAQVAGLCSFVPVMAERIIVGLDDGWGLLTDESQESERQRDKETAIEYHFQEPSMWISTDI